MRQRKVQQPLINLKIFKNIHFTVGTLVAIVTAFTMMGFEYILSQSSNDTSSIDAAIPEFSSDVLVIMAVDANVMAPPSPKPTSINVII